MTLPLKNIPTDVRRHILQIQSEMKIERNTSQYSQPQTIFKIIREHKLFLEAKSKHNS